MAGLSDRLTLGDLCALAYTMLVERSDRQCEIRYQAHISALYMGGEGEPPNLEEMQHEARTLLDKMLNEHKEMTEDERVLREALGLKVW